MSSSVIFKNMISKKLLKNVICINKRANHTATFAIKPYKLHKIEDNGPNTESTITKEQALKYYTEMSTIRRIETSANALYKEKSIRGFCHLYSGQEAVAVGIENAITKDDMVVSSYRIHGWAYIRGVEPFSVLAELVGSSEGCTKGKGGSMHMYTKNFFGGNGIVGSQVPIGAGLGFALKYLEKPNVAIAVYGDGAANQGQLFEAYNMAKLWNLPCIFVCENNGYGMGTSVRRSSASTDYYSRGDYVPGLWVDGMDVLAVKEATAYLKEKCINGKGPFLLETETYRYSGHSMSDPGTSYRTRDEVQEVRHNRDPITHFKEKIINENLVSSADIKQIDHNNKKKIEEATIKAKKASSTHLDELCSNIYLNPLENNVRGPSPYVTYRHTISNKPFNLN